jgi:D-alanyl-D-alanine carboxypeptidase (penicillin-binding protein 5/6)
MWKQRGAALAAGFVVALAAQSTLSAAPAAASVATPVTAKPKKFTLPKAVSWVGGRKLIGTGVLTDLPVGTKRPPVPAKAASWLVADLNARTVLAGRGVHVPLAPASTLKIFTALTLAPKLDPKSVYVGRSDDAAIDGTKVGIVPGSKYTVNDLLHGLLMVSGNDCANALANAAGGLPSSVSAIQAEAKALGAFDTVVRGPSGLDAKGQVSSAYDLALGGTAALQNKQLSSIMTTPTYKFPGKGKSLSAKRTRFQTQNHNRLLGKYDGTIGVKNGFTTNARGTFVGAATRDGHTYLAVSMRSDTSTADVSALLDWAFQNGSKARPVGTLVKPGELTSMTGPGLPAPTAVAAPPTPGATVADGSAESNDTALQKAVPTASTSITGEVAFLENVKFWMVLGALMVVTICFLVGRRPFSSGRH